MTDSNIKPLQLIALLQLLKNEKTIVFTASIVSTHRLFLLLNCFESLSLKVVEYSSLQHQHDRRYTLFLYIFHIIEYIILWNIPMHSQPIIFELSILWTTWTESRQILWIFIGLTNWDHGFSNMFLSSIYLIILLWLEIIFEHLWKLLSSHVIFALVDINACIFHFFLSNDKRTLGLSSTFQLVCWMRKSSL